jgi:hypothetical protein
MYCADTSVSGSKSEVILSSTLIKPISSVDFESRAFDAMTPPSFESDAKGYSMFERLLVDTCCPDLRFILGERIPCMSLATSLSAKPIDAGPTDFSWR